jgi:hypothetical protein
MLHKLKRRAILPAAALTLALVGIALPPATRPASAADAKEVKLDAAQQDAAGKLRAKGAAVMQIAADTDALAVNLGIVGKQATNEDLALVKLLPKVQQLDLHGTAVTDAGLANIASQTALTHLHLNGTAVTDAGLAHLKDLSALEYLNLYNTGVTDAGLKNLEGLKKLRKLYLWQTKVTDAGAKALKAAVPEIALNRGEELTLPPPATKPADPKDTKPAVAAADKPAADKPAAKKGKGKKPAAAAPAAAPAADIDAEGFIRSWLVFGPIGFDGSGGEEIDKSLLPDEATLQPKAGDKAKVKDRDVAWQKVTAKDFFLDFNEILKAEGETNVVAYAVAYVEAPAETAGVTLLMGSNDQGKAYLNGKELTKFAETRGLEKDTEKAENLTLKKGTNVVVLKVINEANAWQGCLRLVGKDGKSVAGLKVKTEP